MKTLDNKSISDKDIENFCITFLRELGYIVSEYTIQNTDMKELDIIKYFYKKNKEKTSLTADFFINVDIDMSVLKTLVQLLIDEGMDYTHALSYIKNLIDYLFENYDSFGGPFSDLRIFSSKSFVRNLISSYNRNKNIIEDLQWQKHTDSLFSKKQYNSKDIVNELRLLRNKNGKS